MSAIILHHYDASPYANKIRKVLGYKGLPWQSVIIPEIMPKPDLVALTGGYRMTPVMQVGANIYCDSHLIASQIDHLRPNPALYPQQQAVSIAALEQWSNNLFLPLFVVLVGHGGIIDEPFLEDRNKVMHEALSPESARAKMPESLASLRSAVVFLEQQLDDGPTYLLGNEPNAADFAVDVVVSTLFLLPPFSELLADCPHLAQWAGRMAAIPNGERSEISSQQALDVARDAEPVIDGGASDGHDGFEAGDIVEVTPSRLGRCPVEGKLVVSNTHEVVVLRETDALGEVAVHFPRAHVVVNKVHSLR
ncbi:MAG: glutathione S-transferase family protein [Gammaproteobacteria bacterium]|nr:glutathione S-transferase family protein [Gammaproteobacteria bacterium]